MRCSSTGEKNNFLWKNVGADSYKPLRNFLEHYEGLPMFPTLSPSLDIQEKDSFPPGVIEHGRLTFLGQWSVKWTWHASLLSRSIQRQSEILCAHFPATLISDTKSEMQVSQAQRSWKVGPPHGESPESKVNLVWQGNFVLFVTIA